MDNKTTDSVYRWPVSRDIVSQDYEELQSEHDKVSISYTDEGSSSNELSAIEWLRRNPHTTKLSALLKRSSSLGQGLLATSPTHTVFAPTDGAFESFLTLSDEKMEDLLRHHISPHEMSSNRILETPNVPTLLRPGGLNGPVPLRIRPSSEKATLLINNHAVVTNADIRVKDGLIHLIDNILQPPPRLGSLLAILPNEQFSIVRGILQKANYCEELDAALGEGGTFFVPTNEAFYALKDQDAALRCSLLVKESQYDLSLLKLHVSPGETLFSNMFYHGKNEAGVTSRPLELPSSLKKAAVAGNPSGDSKDVGGKTTVKTALPKIDSSAGQSSKKVIQGKRHFPLPTLLPDVWIGADITRYGGIISMGVSGGGGVITQDVILANCVVHAVDQLVQPLSGTLREVLEADVTKRSGKI